MAECPTCGDTFDDTGGMRYHHARVHGESIAGDEVTCDNCGVSFRRNPAKVRGKDNVYCDLECQKWGLRPDISKHDLYQLYWGEQKITGDIADVIGCEAKTVQAIADDYGIPMIGNSRHHDAWLFQMRPYRWKYDEYVSRNKSTYQIARENGVDQNWVRLHLHNLSIPIRNNKFRNSDTAVKKTYDYGPEWLSIRSERLERDNHTCQGCGTREDDVGGQLHVHHIKPFRSFENRDEANQMDNLVSLCVNCHNRWEGVPLKPTT